MNINYCQLTAIAALSGSLIACGAKNSESVCANHDADHVDHIEEVVRVEIDYSASTYLFASVTVPDDMASAAAQSSLLESENVMHLQSKEDCVHDPVRVVEMSDRSVYQYQVDCGEGSDIDRIDTELMDFLPATAELDVSITSPAATKNFVVHRDCSSPIYTYL